MDVEASRKAEVAGDGAGAASHEARSVRTALRSDNVVGLRAGKVDFYGVGDLLTEEERAARERVRGFVDAEVLPVIGGFWERGEYPKHLLPKVAALGVAGGSLEGYGLPGMSAVAEGLVTAEMARGDVGIFAVPGVSGMVMRVVSECGSEEQKERWLPPMARMEKVGAFAITEPSVGSDAAAMRTKARREGGEYVLDGAKRWVGNAGEADVVLVWARDEEGKVGAFLVEKGAPGFTAEVMAGKGSARVLQNYDIALDGVRVPAENRVANCRGFRDASSAMTHTRYNVACVALGQAIACYEAALAYTTKREQFGRPVASFQLVQQKLVWMLTEITAMQLLCWRLGRLIDCGEMEPEQASMAKLNNASKARKVAAAARDVMGGNGVLLENHVIRQQADIESTYSYEGTDHVQTLMIGRKVTGYNAFA